MIDNLENTLHCTGKEKVFEKKLQDINNKKEYLIFLKDNFEYITRKEFIINMSCNLYNLEKWKIELYRNNYNEYIVPVGKEILNTMDHIQMELLFTKLDISKVLN